MTEHHHEQTPDFIIGHGLGPVGRWFRLFIGAYFLIFLVINPVLLDPMPRAELVGFATEIGLWVIAITAIYFVVFYFLGELLLSKMNPWTGTLVFLGTPTVLGMLGYLPQPVQMAFGLYVSLSLILIFVIRYGGCEVVALPTLILGQRFTMYCPYNAVDAVERAVTPGSDGRAHQFVTILSLGIVVLDGGYFFLVEMQNLLGRYGIAVDIDNRWALLLFIPVAQLAWQTWRAFRDGDSRWNAGVRKYGLGALVLGALTLSFAFDQVQGRMFWLAAMAMGAAYVVYEIGKLVVAKVGGRAVTETPAGE